MVDPSKGERQWRRRGAGDNALTLDYAKIVKFEVMQWPYITNLLSQLDTCLDLSDFWLIYQL